jgi:hypothetical protein
MRPAPDTAKVQIYFERALQIVRSQQARSWELRAAASLARLLRDRGRRAEADDFLAGRTSSLEMKHPRLPPFEYDYEALRARRWLPR